MTPSHRHSAAAINRQVDSPGWYAVDCERAGLSLAVLAPLGNAPQRKSLNSSEKVVCNLGPWILSETNGSSDTGLPHLRAITYFAVIGVMRRNLTCHRHHPDQGCGHPETSTTPSFAVRSPGSSKYLMQ